MDLYDFLDRIIGPEFTFCRIHDLATDSELARGFADDLLNKSKTLIQKYNMITWYIINEDVFINVRKKEK